jgi:hypothetical protein
MRNVLTALLHLLLLAFLAPALAADEVQALFEKAEEYARKGAYAQSRKLFREIEEKHPGTPWAEKASSRTGDNCLLRAITLGDGGPPENRVDIVFMGDGFLLDPRKQSQFDKMVQQAISLFEKQRTFREYLSYFNFHQLNLASKDDGVDMAGREYDTILDAKASGGSQGQVVVDRTLVRKYLTLAPWGDGFGVVMVLKGTLGTGGGGIATFGGGPGSTFIHEWGHAFAPLGDEYSSDTGHRGGVRDCANVSGTDDPEQVPWKHFLEARTPGVGIYEGANGQTKGAWKPTVQGCIMGSGGSDFCVVCREAIVLTVYRYVDPIDTVRPTPSAEPIVLGKDATLEFAVSPLVPATHKLAVSWTLENVGKHQTSDLRRYGREASGPSRRRDYKDAMVRSPQSDFPELKGEELEARVKRSREGIEEIVVLKGADLDKGDYRLTVEVNDPTDWVVLDDNNLLVSRRTWLLSVVEGAPSR